eukprot:4904830-Pleurochrysis_carterae.AAC.4
MQHSINVGRMPDIRSFYMCPIATSSISELKISINMLCRLALVITGYNCAGDWSQGAKSYHARTNVRFASCSIDRAWLAQHVHSAT